MAEKLVSILMGVYNGAPYLREAIHSILSQTYENWEFIICDDGSTDDSMGILQEYEKKYPDKFKLLQNERNLGLSKVLNLCFQEAKGDYIARMDADDQSFPLRFEKQVDFLEKNPSFALVGAQEIFFDQQGDWYTSHMAEYPTKADFKSPMVFGHPVVMIRRQVFQEVGGYCEEKFAHRVEDLYLWLKIYEKNYKGYNIPCPLLRFRDDRDSCVRRRYQTRINEFYVRLLAMKQLKLGFSGFVYAFKPLLVGLLPVGLYGQLRRKKLQKQQ